MSPKIIFDVSVVWTILGYVTEMREEINMGRRLNRGKKGGESTYKLLYIREKEMGTATWKCEDIYRAFVRTGKRKHGMCLVSFTGIEEFQGTVLWQKQGHEALRIMKRRGRKVSKIKRGKQEALERPLTTVKIPFLFFCTITTTTWEVK